MEKKTLQMIFATQGGSTMTISVDNIKDDLNSEEVSSAMDELLSLDVFTSSSGNPISKKSAKIVTQVTEEIALV
ncbi:DUF2922 domain-containing protein [Defluviitalea phaphyphila]|uniref:DUF2922 domain-containing protein n=1 Tax=Defluviitalea phaphyphila TaxID=1473580 RepID=UPI00072FABB8|nr:DUF2922 domain-containing protein [Defluviitalea phaphyphila]